MEPKDFRWFVQYFRRHFDCRTLADAHQAARADGDPPRPLLAVTFDDGQIDNFRYARPILDACGVPATFFVPADAARGGDPLWHDRLAFGLQRLRDRSAREFAEQCRARAQEVGSVSEMVEAAKSLGPETRRAWIAELEAQGGTAVPTWDGFMGGAELRTLAGSGHEVGSHGASHELLTDVAPDRLAEETGGSRSALEELVQEAVTAFCYPNGTHDPTVRASVKAAGYARAVTTEWGSNDRIDDPLRLRRCDMADANTRRTTGGLSESRLAWRLSGWHPGLSA